MRGSKYPTENPNRQVKTVGGEMHWGFILLHPIDFRMRRVGVCTLKCVHTQFTHSRSYWQLLQSLKGGEWKCPNTSSSTEKAESQAGQPLGFVCIFPFKQSGVPHGQVAAVPICALLPCTSRDKLLALRRSGPWWTAAETSNAIHGSCKVAASQTSQVF